MLKARTLFWTLTAAVLMVAYTNCGKDLFEPPTANFSSSATYQSLFSGSCEADLMNLYARTYHPFLSSKCVSCHTNGPGIGTFGARDFNTSYQAFKSTGRNKIHQQALNAGHQPSITGPQNAATLDPFVAQWTSAEATYQTCMSKEPGGAPSTDGILTLHKSNAQILPRASSPNTWTRIEWDLLTELAKDDDKNKYPLVAGIDIRVATIGGIRRGYEFRNPTLRLKTAGTPYTAKGLRLSINDSELVDVTTYANINYGVTLTTNENLAAGYSFALAVMDPIAATDRFAMEFMSLSRGNTGSNGGGGGGGTNPGTTLPTTVTWTQLTSNDATLGVLRRNCVSCHGATNPRAGLNMLDYNQARAQATEIQSRMNNSGNPMPPSGIVTFNERELIRIWIQNGMPQ